jgi:hypothetical protein
LKWFATNRTNPLAHPPQPSFSGSPAFRFIFAVRDSNERATASWQRFTNYEALIIDRSKTDGLEDPYRPAAVYRHRRLSGISGLRIVTLLTFEDPRALA